MATNMISFLKVIEGVLSLYANYSDFNTKIKYTPDAIELLILEDFPLESRKANGFPLYSDFGWNVNVIQLGNERESVSEPEYLMIQRDVEPDPLTDSLCASGNERNRYGNTKKKKRRRAFSKLRRDPSWNWTESRLLKALVICAQEDPDASQVLAVELNETDDESRWRELENPRLEFLQLAGNLGEKLRVMKEEARQMRREVKVSRIEMEREESKVKSMQQEVQQLSTELLEVIGADMMLKALGLNLRTNSIEIHMYCVKRRKIMKTTPRFRILSLLKF